MTDLSLRERDRAWQRMGFWNDLCLDDGFLPQWFCRWRYRVWNRRFRAAVARADLLRGKTNDQG